MALSILFNLLLDIVLILLGEVTLVITGVKALIISLLLPDLISDVCKVVCSHFHASALLLENQSRRSKERSKVDESCSKKIS